MTAGISTPLLLTISIALLTLDFYGYYSDALIAMACRGNTTISRTNIRCEANSIIVMHKVKVGFGVHSCTRDSIECIEDLTSDHSYYRNLSDTCENRNSCQVSTGVLFSGFPTDFPICSPGNAVRNMVEVTYDCVSASTTTTTTRATDLSRQRLIPGNTRLRGPARFPPSGPGGIIRTTIPTEEAVDTFTTINQNEVIETTTPPILYEEARHATPTPRPDPVEAPGPPTPTPPPNSTNIAGLPTLVSPAIPDEATVPMGTDLPELIRTTGVPTPTSAPNHTTTAGPATPTPLPTESIHTTTRASVEATRLAEITTQNKPIDNSIFLPAENIITTDSSQKANITNRLIANTSVTNATTLFRETTTEVFTDVQVADSSEEEPDKGNSDGGTQKQADRSQTTSTEMKIQVIVPVLTAAVVAAVLIAATLVIRRQRRKNSRDLENVHGNVDRTATNYSMVSSTYDTISGVFSNNNGDPVDDAYYSQLSPDRGFQAAASIPKSFVHIRRVSIADTVNHYEDADGTSNDYYEAVTADENLSISTADESAYYTSIKKNSPKQSPPAGGDESQQPAVDPSHNEKTPVLIPNNLYEATDTASPTQPSETRVNTENLSPVEPTAFIENDLYNSWQ